MDEGRTATLPGPLPTGTVTFLFTDIEGSTDLLRRLGDRYADVLAEHRRLLRAAFAEHGGHEVDTQGDSFFVAFASPHDAVAAAAAAQRALAAHPWPDGAAVRVRIGLHTGEATGTESGYVGLSVHRAARIAASAHGGQVVLSEATAVLVADDLPDGVALRGLGEHRLRDFPKPATLAQLEVAGLPTRFPLLRTGGRFGALPAASAALVGRDEDVAALAGVLRAARTRMVTLTGPGGIGKTSLALAAARAVAEDFPGGAVLVPLGAVTDPALVLGVVADRLGARREPGTDLVQVLHAAVGDERTLLVLDNFEQVVDAGPDLAAVLDDVPAAVALVTSRTVLRVRAERQYPVGPLDPAAAVSLFVERARAVDPGFAPDAAEGAAVAEICRRLDGLPLAIELAAARVRLFGPAALLARLETRLDVLTRGAADLPERQRSLRTAMDWSFALLHPHEQALFTRLGVFSGGWTLEAAETVCGRAGEPDVVDTLAALLDSSLVRPAGDAGPEPRFTLLETVRTYAAEKLAASPERAETERRHTAWVAALTDPLPHGEAQLFRAALRRFDRERANVRSAVQRAIDQGDVPTAALLIRNALSFLSRRDGEREVIRWLEQTLSIAGGAPPEVRGRLLVVRALLAGAFSDVAALRPLLEEARRCLPDDAEHAYESALAAMAGFYLAAEERDLAGARRAVEETSTRFRALHLDLGVAFMAVFAGDLDLVVGDLEGAERHYGRGLEIAIRMDDDALAGQALSLRGLVLLARGDVAGARRAVIDGAAANRRGGEPTGMAYSLEGLAAVALADGRPAVAAEALAAAAAARARSALPVSPVLAHMVAELAARARADLGDAAYQAACAAGCRCSVREALERALDGVTAERHPAGAT